MELAVEERLPVEDIVRVHGINCPHTECQNTWSDFVLLNAAIKQWRARTPQADFTDRIVAKSLTILPVTHRDVENGPEPKRNRPLSFLRWMISGVAALLVFTAVILLNRGPVKEDAPAELATSFSIENHHQALGTLFIRWVDGASSGVTGSVASILTEKTPSAPAEASSQQSSWIQLWGEQIKPLEEELGKAYRVFVEEELLDQTHIEPASRGSVT